MSFAEGENIGPYRIIERLGQGGMATVYKAYHASLDRYVALKVLHPAFHEDETFLGRFQREARVVAKLEHPRIVPVYDYAEHENRPYLVMKFIEGETLKSRLSRGSLSSEEITQVVEAVGSALAHAHESGILHRDIKPSNVLINNDGQMYLADFGLARIAQAGESTLSSDSIMGTPQYISPEQARGDKDLDEGTDIYSFGVMLYELVVGQVPFSADTPFSIIHDHIYTPLPLPRTINKKVPESVERVLLKALAKDRADRYEDVPSMAKAFISAWATAGVPMEGTALTLPSVTAVQDQNSGKTKVSSNAKTALGKEPKKKKKRSPWVFIASGLLLLICCLFVFFATGAGDDLFANRAPTEAPNGVVDVPRRDGPSGSDFPAKPVGRDDFPPELIEARRYTKSNPDDPYGFFELSLIYWDIGMPRPAYENLDIAANLASGDIDFLIEAGNEFREREAWIASTAMYLRAIKRIGFSGDVPQEVEENFRQSVYMAAPDPELELTYPLIEEIMKVDQPIGLVGQARHAYYNGNFTEAKVFLNKVNTLDPGLPESALLEGEMSVIEQQYDLAKLILLPLTSDLNSSPWIRAMAEDFINHIP
ncbi:MAG: serine/threonine-protein kinase [Anaerolineae bacterium]|nr:serine/threonine-protein kinase [Anaerolineae bacterium]